MIRIDRNKISPPESLEAIRSTELRKLREFYDKDAKFQRQRKTSFDIGALTDEDVKVAVRKVSHSKCAYCETQLTADLVIDQFRPKRGAIRADGRIDTDHYWWLAYDWDNQLPSCYVCNRNKGARFPIDGRAAQAETRGEALIKERPRLIDPSVDFPESTLR